MTNTAIAIDRFYDENQRVRNHDDDVFVLFAQHCLDIVKGRFVRAASKLNLQYKDEIGRTGETRTLNVTDVKSLIKHYTQMSEVTERDQKSFYYILYDSFETDWEVTEEATLMAKLRYEYEGDMKELGVLKGDVAKCLSSKKQDQVKNIKKAVIKTHPSLNVQLKRVDQENEYERGRKEMGLFYVKAITQDKVSKIVNLL
jgi:hypothetical protein